MRIIKLLIIFSVVLFYFVPNFVLAQTDNAQGLQGTDLYFFEGQGCPHCAQAKIFLGQLKNQYPLLNIRSFEVFYNQDNRQLYFAFARAYGLKLNEVPVPFILVGEKSFVGFNDTIGGQIRNEVARCAQQKCPSPSEKLSSVPPNQNFTSIKQEATGWIVIGLVIAMAIFFLIKLIFRKKKII